MLLFDNAGRCINAMKLVSNKMILKNAYFKIKSDALRRKNSGINKAWRERQESKTPVAKGMLALPSLARASRLAIFDAISEE
jgi:hypothetical protein